MACQRDTPLVLPETYSSLSYKVDHHCDNWLFGPLLVHLRANRASDGLAQYFYILAFLGWHPLQGAKNPGFHDFNKQLIICISLRNAGKGHLWMPQNFPLRLTVSATEICPT